MNTRTYFEDIDAWPRRAPRADGKPHRAWPAYVIGFLLSLACVLEAYEVVLHPVQTFSFTMLIGFLVALACLQFVAQLVFFFHLSPRAGSRDRLVMLACTILIVGILIAGSVWVMFSLSDRMMPSSSEMEMYMKSQPGL